jgi:uncharacterized protein with HEPN domain
VTVRDAEIALNDILGAIAGVREAVGSADFATYAARRPLRRAVEREIEIISEASRRVPTAMKEQEPGIPWREIAGIGNVLRHDYRVVADRIVWNVVEVRPRPLGGGGQAAPRGGRRAARWLRRPPYAAARVPSSTTRTISAITAGIS